jgi:hypothetical protein
MKLENRRVCLTIEDQSGAVTGLLDKQLGRSYIGGKCTLLPFRIALTGGMEVTESRFSFTISHDAAHLQWDIPQGVLLAEVILLDDGVSFRARLQNHPGQCVKAFEYPLLSGLADWGMSGYLAHSYATGILLRDPLAYLPETGALRYTPYPESFSGASMQFFTYYEQGMGGLYFCAEDGAGHQKWLNACKENGHLTVSHIAGMEDIRNGSAIEMAYAFNVSFTAGNGWEEAAERYKAWAYKQPWCRRGPARDRTDKADWLLEKAGLCTFGISAGHDRTKWLRRFHTDIGTPVFHVLGPDWTNTPQTFDSGIPGGMGDWVPTRFCKANLDVIRENGDYFAPFEFDFLVAPDKSDRELLQPNLQVFPKPAFSHDAYAFTMLCPCSGFTKAFHRERDRVVVRESGADAMYYDISANNLIKVCESGNHGHTPGGGKEITDGYADVYEDTRAALCGDTGRYFPLGTEIMNEVYLPQLDFYQARAWAQPCSTLETYPFREQMRSGLASMIPLFDYVYHEMGVVRMDGWGKLVEETGELFYHNAAKIYLWGGLYELNYEYSPMEELDGEETSGSEHYFHFDPQHCDYSPLRAAYIRMFALARTGLANPYWAYGKMAPMPRMDIPEVSLSWYHYNHAQKDPSYKAKGAITVGAVAVSAFDNGFGGYALFLANADSKAHRLSFSISHAALRLAPGGKTACLISGFDTGTPRYMDLGMLCEGENLPLSVRLAPRALYMLEIK